MLFLTATAAPERSEQTLPDLEKPLALLFVDIADSTMLYERAGNATAAALTQRVLGHLRQIVQTHNGAVIKSLGDGLLGAFSEADESSRAALAIMAVQSDHGVRLRVGIHFGPVIPGIGDLYGDACNVAARVQQIARPGEILATDALVGRLSPREAARTKLLNNVSFKGKALPVLVHRIREVRDEEEEAVDSTTLGFSLDALTGGTVLTLHLSYRGRELVMNRMLPRVTVGREESSGLRILSRQTSRQHAVIDFSRDSFILTDHSTNGTFIRSGESPPLLLRRDSTKLVGSGLIGFGAEAHDSGEDHVVAFRGELA